MKDCGFPAVRITLADVCPEDYGINPHLRTWGGSRGRYFLPPLHPGATGATAKSAPRGLLPAWLCSSAVPHVARKMLHVWGVQGAGRQPHTGRPLLFLYDEVTVIIPHVSAKDL